MDYLRTLLIVTWYRNTFEYRHFLPAYKSKKKNQSDLRQNIYIYQSHNSLKSNYAFIKFCYTQWLDYIFAVRIKANNILRKSRVCFHKYVYVKVTTSYLPNLSNIFFSCTKIQTTQQPGHTPIRLLKNTLIVWVKNTYLGSL